MFKRLMFLAHWMVPWAFFNLASIHPAPDNQIYIGFFIACFIWAKLNSFFQIPPEIITNAAPSLQNKLPPLSVGCLSSKLPARQFVTNYTTVNQV